MGLTHMEWIFVAALAIYVAFKFVSLLQPQTAVDISFILHAHWGDCIGLWLIALGVAIAAATPWLYHGSDVAIVSITKTGDGLIYAGIMALKLKTVPGPSNGTLVHKEKSTEIPPEILKKLEEWQESKEKVGVGQ